VNDSATTDRKTSGALIDVARRTPASCLYCSTPATSKEHALTEAVGGRLWARVLCPVHNSAVNTGADQRFNRNFAPLVTMLQVRCQRALSAPSLSPRIMTESRS
jgi:hypothetical protein